MKDISRTGHLMAQFIARWNPILSIKFAGRIKRMENRKERSSQSPFIGDEQVALLEKLSNAVARFRRRSRGAQRLYWKKFVPMQMMLKWTHSVMCWSPAKRRLKIRSV
jgi:hypothetical protein